MKILTTLMIQSALLLAMLTATAFAENVVIVHPSNSNSLDSEMINRLFLGKAKSFPNGQSATPINLNDKQALREVFDKQILDKTPSQIKAYWSKLIFTGKGTPPEEVGSGAEVKAKVASDPSAIGYIDSSAVDDTVKVVQKF